MTKREQYMRQFEVIITEAEGLPARPAGMLVKRTSGCKSSIQLEKHSDGKTADAKKMLAVMALCAKTGELLKVTIAGDDEEQVAKELEIFFKENI